MLWSCRVCASTALMRMEALPDPPFDQDDFPAIDFGMWLRMALGWEMAFIAEPLAAYRIHRRCALGRVRPAGRLGLHAAHEIVTRLKDVKLRFVERFRHRLDDQRRAARPRGAVHAPRADLDGAQRDAAGAAFRQDRARARRRHARRPATRRGPAAWSLSGRPACWASGPSRCGARGSIERACSRPSPSHVKVVILAGGLGTPPPEETEIKPKPMVEIGGRPILWHIMKHLRRTTASTSSSSRSATRATTSSATSSTTRRSQGDLTIDLGDGEVEAHEGERERLDASTSSTPARRPRPAAAQAPRAVPRRRHLHADLRRRRRRRRPRRAARRSTARTASSPRSPRCGRRRASAPSSSTATRSREFTEKPQIGEGWINGGFFVLEPEVFDYIDGDDDAVGAASRWSGWPRDGAADGVPPRRLLAVHGHAPRARCCSRSSGTSGDAPWKVWAVMRVLVTGHDGYIGRVLVPLLLRRGPRGHRPRHATSTAAARFGTRELDVPAIASDIRDVAARATSRGFDAVVHLAGALQRPARRPRPGD